MLIQYLNGSHQVQTITNKCLCLHLNMGTRQDMILEPIYAEKQTSLDGGCTRRLVSRYAFVRIAIVIVMNLF
jgi:hypothetical protein